MTNETVNETINVKELDAAKVQTNTYVRYRTSDGLVFMSREEYLDYVKGLRD